MWILKNVYLLTTHSHTSAADAMMMEFTKSTILMFHASKTIAFVFWDESIPFCFNISKQTQITRQDYLYHTNIFK